MSKNYVVSSWIDGEGFHTWTPVAEEKLRALEVLLGTDFVDDISAEHPMEIKVVSDEQLRQSSINGALYDGYSQENAERIADGDEPLEELDD